MSQASYIVGIRGLGLEGRCRVISAAPGRASIHSKEHLGLHDHSRALEGWTSVDVFISLSDILQIALALCI